MATFEQAEHVVRHLIEAIVDNTDAVTVRVFGTAPSMSITICVAPEDMGKVIGKQGRTARSIRIVALGIGMKLGVRMTVTISERGESSSAAKRPAF